MSQIRHSEPSPGHPIVRTMSVGFSSGYHWRVSTAEWGVLVWASHGVAVVTTPQHLFVIAPQQALWLPPTTAHTVRLSGRGTVRQVYVDPSRCHALPTSPSVTPVSPLLREILRRMCELGTLHDTSASDHRLLGLLHDDIRSSALAPSTAPDISPPQLPMPVDRRARQVADAVRAMVTHDRSLTSFAREARTSGRTLERLFRAETGLSFGAWKRRACIVHAMTLLADGASVTAAGLATGYVSTSAFVAAFRRVAGITPGQYARSVSRVHQR